MHVSLEMGGQRIGSEGYLPYFRGKTYNYYTGNGWRDRGGPAVSTRPADPGATLASFLPIAVEQDYLIQDGPPRILFSLAQSVPITISSDKIPQVLWDPADATLVPADPDRLPATVRYRLQSVPPHILAQAPIDPARPGALPAQSAARRHPYPTPAVQREVFALARSLAAEITGNPDDPAADPAAHEQIVNRFMQHLAGPDFTYSLQGQPRGGRNNLEKFLFQTKRGYCEYYATALAVLCQCVGIPARYVTGFHGGRYNQVDNFYSVRDSDAHSWVEVYLPDSGWRLFDPTPAAETPTRQSGLRTQLADILDYLQFQWSSWVVAYDILHRQALLGTLGSWMQEPAYRQDQHTWSWLLSIGRELLVGPETLSLLGKILYWLGLLGLLALSGYLLFQVSSQLLRWSRSRRHSRAARHVGVRFYQQVVAALALRGYVRRPAETPREFARRVEHDAPTLRGLLVPLVDLYYAARFGRTTPADEGTRLGRRILLNLTTARYRSTK